MSIITNYIVIPPNKDITKKNSTTVDWISITSSSNGQYLAAILNEDGRTNSPVYTSNDYGTTWDNTNNAPPSNNGINALWSSITSSSSGQYLAATQLYSKASESSNGGYIYTSNDYGKNWVQRATTVRKRWMSITSSSSGKYLAAVIETATSSTTPIYISNDYGSTWNIAVTLSSNSDLKRTIASNSDGSLLAITHDTEGIYIMKKNYGTWNTQVVPNTSGKSWRSITVSTNGQYLAAVYYGDGNNIGKIFISKDFGVTWTETNAPGANWTSITSSGSGQYLAAASATNAYSSKGIYTSNDYGESWVFVTGSIQNYWTSITSSSSGNLVAAVNGFGGSGNRGIYTFSINMDVGIMLGSMISELQTSI